MKKWLGKQVSAFVLGFLDEQKKYRSTPDSVLDALNIVTEFIVNKYWKWKAFLGGENIWENILYITIKNLY